MIIISVPARHKTTYILATISALFLNSNAFDVLFQSKYRAGVKKDNTIQVSSRLSEIVHNLKSTPIMINQTLIDEFTLEVFRYRIINSLDNENNAYLNAHKFYRALFEILKPDISIFKEYNVSRSDAITDILDESNDYTNDAINTINQNRVVFLTGSGNLSIPLEFQNQKLTSAILYTGRSTSQYSNQEYFSSLIRFNNNWTHFLEGALNNISIDKVSKLLSEHATILIYSQTN